MRHRLLDALVDGGPEALRDDAADDLVDELVALVAGERLEHDLAVAELAAAARLLLVAALGARLLADRLEVRDARLVQVDLDAEAPPEPVDRHLDVHLARARREAARRSARRAAASSVGSSSCRRRSAVAIFSSSPFAFGVIAKLITGCGKSSGGRSIGRVLGEEHVAGAGLLQLGDGADVAVGELVRRLVILALEQEQLADRSFPRVRELTRFESDDERAREHAEDVDAARERVGDGLEDERRGPAPSTAPSSGFLAGDGMPSTSRSRRPVVPRFFVATPQATGKRSPFATAFLSAAASSSRRSSSPSSR